MPKLIPLHFLTLQSPPVIGGTLAPPAVPVMSLTGNGQAITAGNTPSEANYTHFFVIQTGGTLTRQFNIAVADAALTGVNVVASAGFSVSVAPSATINAAANSNFTIAADSSAVATLTGTITIESNELADLTFNVKAYIFPAFAEIIWHKSTFWQDSAGTTPAVANGDVIGRADDWSGNNRHLSQGTTADKPTLDLTSEAFALMSFDGLSDYLSRTATLLTNADFTLFLAWRNPLGATGFIFSEASSASILPQTYIRVTSGVAGGITAVSRDDASSTLTQNSGDLSLNNSAMHYATLRDNGTNRNFRVDGVQVDDDTYNPGATTTTRHGLGAFLRPTIDNFSNAKVAALLIATSALSDANRNVVEAALAEFY